MIWQLNEPRGCKIYSLLKPHKKCMPRAFLRKEHCLDCPKCAVAGTIRTPHGRLLEIPMGGEVGREGGSLQAKVIEGQYTVNYLIIINFSFFKAALVRKGAFIKERRLLHFISYSFHYILCNREK